MKLSKVIERLYLKVFVGIVIMQEKCDVVIEIVRGDDVNERISESFETTVVNEAMVEFIEPYLAESPFYYVALLNPIKKQGALPTCLERKAKEFIDTSTAITLCQDRRWMVYADKPELDVLKKQYQAIGFDFIFSPFLVIKYFFHDKISNDHALFVLTEENAISVSVFYEGNLLFAQYIPIEDELLRDIDVSDATSLSFELEDDDLDEGIELDDINAIEDLDGLDDLNDIEDLDGLDDLNDIEDLDTLDEIEDFSDVPAGADERVAQEQRSEVQNEVSSLEGFNHDFKRFQLIQSALQSFYSDPKYENRFIESVYIADSCSVSDDLKYYLEEELFLKVYIRRIELAAEIVDLAKADVQYAS